MQNSIKIQNIYFLQLKIYFFLTNLSERLVTPFSLKVLIVENGFFCAFIILTYVTDAHFKESQAHVLAFYIVVTVFMYIGH